MALDGQPGETGRGLVVDLELVVDHGLLLHVLGGRVEDEERPQEQERR